MLLAEFSAWLSAYRCRSSSSLFLHPRHHFFPFLALLRLDIAAAFFFASALLLAPHARVIITTVSACHFCTLAPSCYPYELKLALLGLSPFLTGAFRFMPCRLADARPLAFKPPLGFLPAFRCHAGVLAIFL